METRKGFTTPKSDTSEYERGLRDGALGVIVMLMGLLAMGIAGGMERGSINVANLF